MRGLRGRGCLVLTPRHAPGKRERDERYERERLPWTDASVCTWSSNRLHALLWSTVTTTVPSAQVSQGACSYAEPLWCSHWQNRLCSASTPTMAADTVRKLIFGSGNAKRFEATSTRTTTGPMRNRPENEGAQNMRPKMQQSRASAKAPIHRHQTACLAPSVKLGTWPTRQRPMRASTPFTM
jgi:hypothetical protein